MTSKSKNIRNITKEDILNKGYTPVIFSNQSESKRRTGEPMLYLESNKQTYSNVALTINHQQKDDIMDVAKQYNELQNLIEKSGLKDKVKITKHALQIFIDALKKFHSQRPILKDIFSIELVKKFVKTQEKPTNENIENHFHNCKNCNQRLLYTAADITFFGTPSIYFFCINCGKSWQYNQEEVDEIEIPQFEGGMG